MHFINIVIIFFILGYEQALSLFCQKKKMFDCIVDTLFPFFPAPEIKISLSELIPEKPVLLSLRKKQKQSSSPSDAKTSPFKQKSATFSFVKKSKNGRGSRRMRRQATVIYIDVVAVIDYGAYQRFLGNSASRSEALEALREYYAFVFNGVRLE